MGQNRDPFENSTEKDSEEEVGYGKPPKHSQWGPGFCPNPKGRPPNAKGRRAILERIANERCEVKVGGKVQNMSRAEVVLLAVRNATANGHPTAQKLFDRLLNDVGEEGPEIPKGVLIVGEKLNHEEWAEKYN